MTRCSEKDCKNITEIGYRYCIDHSQTEVLEIYKYIIGLPEYQQNKIFNKMSPSLLSKLGLNTKLNNKELKLLNYALGNLHPEKRKVARKQTLQFFALCSIISHKIQDKPIGRFFSDWMFDRNIINCIIADMV